MRKKQTRQEDSQQNETEGQGTQQDHEKIIKTLTDNHALEIKTLRNEYENESKKLKDEHAKEIKNQKEEFTVELNQKISKIKELDEKIFE